MKGTTMDGAKNNAEYVAQHLLPDRPYHLSLYHNKKYEKPKGWFFDGPSAPLQYSTYLSDADRGILFTLPPWAITDEPSQMPPAKATDNRAEAKKKFSLKEHMNRKKSPHSPLDNGLLPAKPDSSRTNGNSSTVHARPLPPPPQSSREAPKKEVVKSSVDKTDARRAADSRIERSRLEMNGERNRNPPPRSHPEPDSRKRIADTDGNPPPQKRPRNEVNNSKMEHSRQQSRGEPPRGRDRTNDTKGDALHPTANGLAPSTADRDRENTASPRSTIMVNGGGSRVRSDSGTSTPRKVPDLLSPLHPSLFNNDAEEKKPRKKLADKAPPPASKKPSDGPSPMKRKKGGAVIPALMSPTLPPLVEELLSQLSSKNGELSSSQSSDSPSSARKTITVAAPPPLTLTKPAVEEKLSLIVTLKLKKANAKRAKDLLSLPSKSAKDALKAERAISVENCTPPPAVAAAKKRPRPATEDLPSAPESLPPKRGKTAISEAIIVKPMPTTPLKPGLGGAAMVRAASSQSQGTTPTPGTIERPPTRSEPLPLDPHAKAQMEFCRERNVEYMKLGGRLKKTRDSLLVDRLATANAVQGEEGRCAAVHLEMVLAYMLAFHFLNQARTIAQRPSEVGMWLSLVAHFDELSARVKTYRVLKSLVAQLNGVFLEQLVGAYATLEREAAMHVFEQYRSAVKRKAAVWGAVRKMSMAQSGSADEMKMGMGNNIMGPWTGVEEAVGEALRVAKRWAGGEGVKWVPELNVPGQRDKEKEKDVPPLPPPPKDREREREREREPHPSRGGDRERERERDGHRDERVRDRERERGDRDRDRDRERDRGFGPPPPITNREGDRVDHRERDYPPPLPPLSARDRVDHHHHRDDRRDRDRDGGHRDRDSHRDRDRDRDRERDRDRGRGHHGPPPPGYRGGRDDMMARV